MRERHAYGQLLVRLPFGRWYWDVLFRQVYYIPKGKRRPLLVLGLRECDNNETEALREIVREISPHRGGSNG